MMQNILASEEIYRLSGYRQPSRQRKWLSDNGIPFYVGADGKPRTTLNMVEKVEKSPSSEPDFNGVS